MTARKTNYSITLNSIRCIDDADSWGLGEPYFWIVSFKIGGEEIRQSQKDQFRLEGVPIFTFSQGSHGNIGGPMDVGDVRLIPGTVGSLNSEISPLEFDILGNHIIIPGFIGLVTVLMEEENLTNKEAESGHQAINRLIVYRINKLLRELDLQNIFLEAADLTDPTISITETFFRIFKSKLEYEIFQLADNNQKEIKKAIFNGQSNIRYPWS